MTVATVDLSRHAVIEASAGTGKTYTIEQLVLRILLETDTTLDQILLVTFTEKATGELRTRLRQALEKAQASAAPEPQGRLQAALNQFDQAAIFTIHGFCQRALQEYALEQGQDFRATLVDDAELLPPMLREVQRRLWRTQFGARLRAVLDHAGFSRDTAAVWEAKIREVAQGFQPRSEHQLRPAPVADWWQRLDETGMSWPGQLEVFTVEAVRRQLAEFKQQRGLQSFDDLIARVEENLDPARNPDAPQLVQRLRDRYRFGIVDEFQDTDPLQWQIFRRVFLGDVPGRLFVVGDPKQAIFAFRGADLPTYLRARTEMVDANDAAWIPLQTNWRSAPELLEALNCLFADGDWFAHDPRIQYWQLEPPADEQRQTQVVADLTNRAALTIVDVRTWQRPRDARKQYARFVAREIQQLLQSRGGQPALRFSEKKAPPRPLEASDIGILVFKRIEADPLLEALDDLHIPYSFYRQTGFWHSRTVRELELVLRCLSRPDDRAALRTALLTCFFRIAPADLVRCQDLPSSHPARRLYQEWLACAEARRWSALFQSLLEQTGLLLLALTDDAAAQRLAVLRHVMGALERVGHGENRDLLGLLDWLREKRRQRDPRDAEQPPADSDTQRGRVRIMTIHASKGLEFPVVFLAGGFTGRAAPGAVGVYRDDQERKVFDFCPDAAAQGRMAEESQAESRRLLYVALTRPMFKLYVPLMHLGSRQRAYVGAAATILLPALKQACPDKLGPLVAEIIAPAPLRAFGEPLEPDDLPDDRPVPVALHGALFPTVDPNLEWRRIVVRSFSSLSRHHVANVGLEQRYGERGRSVPDETGSPAEPDDPLRGPVFGDIVHNVLEHIDYAEVGRCAQPAELLRVGSATSRLIDAEVRANVGGLRGKSHDQLEQLAREQVAQLVWHALHTPLAALGGTLAQVPRVDRLHELEFLLPEQPGATRREEAFVTGYMDLVVRRGGLYFLVDFKTNLLAGYGPDQLATCMTEIDYHRQYRLYLHALGRWLQRVKGPTFPVVQHLGGVYYLFVRGLNGRDESTGVFLHRPALDDLDLARTLEK